MQKPAHLLLNYDTEDTSVILGRERCVCGRSHLRISNPQREAETVWVKGTPFNRVDIERGVFQSENMEYLTGEYEAFIYGDDNEVTLRLTVECNNSRECEKEIIKENFLTTFLTNPELYEAYQEEYFNILFNFIGPEDLEFYKIKGRTKRLVDRR